MNCQTEKCLLALTSMESQRIGHCSLNLVVNGLPHDKVWFDILKDLCSDIILGYDFQKQHKQLTFCLGGAKPDSVVSPKTQQVISVCADENADHTNAETPAAATNINLHSSYPTFNTNVEPPSLFKNLSADIKSIATKSRHFNKDDCAFIENQLSTLLKAGHIQRSNCPCVLRSLLSRMIWNNTKRECVLTIPKPSTFLQSLRLILYHGLMIW